MEMKPFVILGSLTFLVATWCLPGGTQAQGPAIDTSLGSQYLEEAEALCNQDNGKLWGVSLCGPILLVDRQTRAIIANQPDKEGLLTKNKNVFVGTLPARLNIANTAIDWAGLRWTMIVFPLPKNKSRRASLIAHELWHRIQDQIGLPSSGAANNHLDSPDGRVWLQLEWRALAAALSSRGKQRRLAITDVLLFRSYRRGLFPKAVAEEREMELHEGLAEYTGVKLSGSPNMSQYVIDEDLKPTANGQTFVRSFAYASGPAYGLLLDDAKPRWRSDLKKTDDLGELLRKTLGIKVSSNLNRSAEERARVYDGDRLQASEAERENNRQKILRSYRARLVDGPVLMIPLQKMNLQFDPGTLIPLEGSGTVYPEIRLVDLWGILTVSKGALINSTFSRIYVSAPRALGTTPIQGDGWTLELNSGWTVTAGERKGDYVVKKSN